MRSEISARASPGSSPRQCTGSLSVSADCLRTQRKSVFQTAPAEDSMAALGTGAIAFWGPSAVQPF